MGVLQVYFLIFATVVCSVPLLMAAGTTNYTTNDDTLPPVLVSPQPEYSRRWPRTGKERWEPWPTECTISASSPNVHKEINELLAWKIKLIEYKLLFPNYTYNPLHVNTTWAYNADKWARVSSTHGQTLLSLAFNYGVMSLMTLSFGVEKLFIELYDSPDGCFGHLEEDDKMATLLHLMLRDFQSLPGPVLVEEERVCHEVVSDIDGYAKFEDRCCFINRMSGTVDCTMNIGNIWLKILYTLMVIVKVLVIFFGPSLFIPTAHIIANQTEPYVVKLKEPLKKKMLLLRKDTPIKATYEHKLDLRNAGALPKLRKSVEKFPIGEVVDAQISQYDILVDYSWLLTENKVPVGLLQCLARAVFFCKLRTVDPFKRCCKANLFRSYDSGRYMPWISFWRRVAAALLLVSIPFPFLLRVYIFYSQEYEQVAMRKHVTRTLGLKETYDNSLIHYLGPLHPAMIIMYLLYIVLCALMVFMVTQPKGRHLKKIAINSFKDLENVSWLKALYVVVSNFIWPFERYGFMGAFIAPFYWLVAVPVTVVLAILFCLPTTYVFFRMIVLTKTPNYGPSRKIADRYIIERNVDDSILNAETIQLIRDPAQEEQEKGEEMGGVTSDADDTADEEQQVRSHLVHPTDSTKRHNKHRELGIIIAILIFLVSLLAFLLLLAECLGFLIEMIVFTLMGIIVNAGQILKYVTLLFLVTIYSYDCYSNVTKKYLKLNKGLFNEMRDRIKDLGEVTSLPSHLQENMGFKSVENSEQADYESPDDLSPDYPRQWTINDLILFIDNEDTPRIPCQLFEEVCQIRVCGSPGPVYRSLLAATQDFLKMVLFLLFVFLIVLSFGAVYQVNSTNQTLATMAGGFLPLMMRNFMKPTTPDIEFGTVSFKSKLDEIIQNFQQTWPIFDFPFEEPNEEDEEEETDSEEENSKEGKERKKRSKKETNNNTGASGMNEGSAGPSNDIGGDTGGVKVEERKYDADIAVFLPEASEEGWIEEWSDYDQYAREAVKTEEIRMQELELINDTKKNEVEIV